MSTMKRAAAAALAALALILASPSAAFALGAGDVWSETVAVSGKPDVAGKEAGRKLKEACRGRQPDLLLAFQFKWTFKTDEERQQVLDGVAESFDRKLIYGHQTGPLNATGGKGGNVGLMALGGVQTSVVNAKIEKGMESEALKTLAEGLKGPYLQAAGKGRLVLLLGSHSGIAKPKEILDAFQNALGKDAPLFGPGSPADAHFFQGALQEKGLTAILVSGNFSCDFAMEESVRENEKILESAAKAMATAIGPRKDNVAAIFVASCEKRGHSMKDGKAEIVPVAEAAGTTSAPLLFIWNYGSEIAIPKTGDAAVVGLSHINVCVIRRGESHGGK
jgi:hypothetical protein